MTNVNILGIEGLVREPIDEFEEFKCVKVNIAKLFTEKKLLLTKEIYEGHDPLLSTHTNRTFVRARKALCMSFGLQMFHFIVNHVHLAPLVRGLAEKFGRVGVRNVDHDGVRISQLHLLVYQVWKGAEGQVERGSD